MGTVQPSWWCSLEQTARGWGTGEGVSTRHFMDSRQGRQAPLRRRVQTGGHAPYLPAGSVVVHVHQRSGVLALPLLGVHERPRKLDPIVNVVAAAAPVESALAVLGGPLLLGITGTGF